IGKQYVVVITLLALERELQSSESIPPGQLDQARPQRHIRGDSTQTSRMIGRGVDEDPAEAARLRQVTALVVVLRSPGRRNTGMADHCPFGSPSALSSHAKPLRRVSCLSDVHNHLLYS